jgi:hypothetical protein
MRLVVAVAAISKLKMEFSRGKGNLHAETAIVHRYLGFEQSRSPKRQAVY